MINQLAAWENYPSRVSACYLLPECYPHLKKKEKMELRQVFSELANYDTPMVRRAAAENLKVLAKSIEPEFVKSDLLPLWALLMKDSVDSVKIKAIETTCILTEFFNKKEVNDHFMDIIKNFDNEKKSWRNR